ncbi:J domain-containing protein [Conyzicola sp.]|uniref:J domain-containing protein n=1 Tax=Conyzicola sp. TaxID=1969404 RepID=UPI0039894116
MPDSPISATPYEVLGVSSSASHDELRRAYRKLARETHPDTGGSSARFVAVQLAWERIGTPEDRAAYDRGRPSSRANLSEPHESWAAPSGRAPAQDTRPPARAYGHPGGWRRERFLGLMREWVGLGAPLPDPYDPALVRSAPREIRHLLADALAEEATARTISALGIGYTVWHDVATGYPDEKIDHVVLGATGLFAVLSEDFGGTVRVKGGELIGEAVNGDRPMNELGHRAKALQRSLRLKFTGLVIVVPDDDLAEPVVDLGKVKGASAAVVRLSYLPALLREGLPGSALSGGNEVFDVRTRLLAGIRFVE